MPSQRRMYMHRANGVTVPEICEVTGANPNLVRQWIYRGYLKRNQWGLVCELSLGEFMQARGLLPDLTCVSG